MAGEASRRRAFITKRGYFGLGPGLLHQGDFVVIFHGANTPLVVRPNEAGYRVLGPAYVYGVMAGEFMEGRSDSEIFFLDQML